MITKRRGGGELRGWGVSPSAATVQSCRLVSLSHYSIKGDSQEPGCSKHLDKC
jgi:hypothetical protein